MEYDFVNGESPNNIISVDIPIIGLNQLTKTITIDVDKIPASLRVGDYMPISGESCIPNVPSEMHPVLAQRVAMRVLEALGDSQGLTNAQNKLNEMESKTGQLLDQRVEGSAHKIKNKQMQYVLRGRFMRGTF